MQVLITLRSVKLMRDRSRKAALILIGTLTLLCLSNARGYAQATPPATPAPQESKFDTLTKSLKKVDGMWPMYHNEQQLLIDLPQGHLGKNFIVLTSIARGISSGMVLGGMSWGFGDDVLWSFNKSGEKIHVVRRNVRFQAAAGTPESNAVKLAYSDSIIYALPILTPTPGGFLVDMSPIFMSDDQEIGRNIGPGFRFANDRSTWAKVKGFERNVELQVAAIYSGAGFLDTVSDARGVQVNVHYSISMLPENSFRPRLADDRIGYFLSVMKNFSTNEDEEHFVRYINRWDLQKAAPAAKMSPPKEPIIFYLEKTVPIHLRPVVRSGIEEWNKAFEKVGFANAIEVRQQRDDDNWDPEDIRYNTFRWITAEAGFAMGPSRVNPLTGQILDADIIFDASFLRFWKTEYETYQPQSFEQMLYAESPSTLGSDPHQHSPAELASHQCSFCKGMQHQLGFAASVFLGRNDVASDGKLPEALINQGLKEVVMHEVGHTLGLRHNFKASSWKNMQSIDDPVQGTAEGTVASVMDYSPANIAPKGVAQGLYYPQTIGPYDFWAIEYGYKPIEGNEAEELKKIAARSAEPGLDYATDEDTRSFDSDPFTNRFDLGSDPLQYSTRQIQTAQELLPLVVQRAVKEGDGYQRGRQAFGILMGEYWHSVALASRFPGGVQVRRDHKGDPNGRAPFQVVDAAKQREAMDLLAKYAFAAPSYDPQLLNQLAATRWSHWGINEPARLDYPIHQSIQQAQSLIVGRLLSPTTLERLQDNELKIPADADAYTLAEHVRRIVEAIYSEWTLPEQPIKTTLRAPYISSHRRILQRLTMQRMIDVLTQGQGVPEDARTLLRMHLEQLDLKATAILEKPESELDDYSKAHLLDSRERIRKALQADLVIPTGSGFGGRVINLFGQEGTSK
ncbi:MAG: zinc-dependent metalloprotease [Planctomycetaceae bacterium]